jgi:hypothetical protein
MRPCGSAFSSPAQQTAGPTMVLLGCSLGHNDRQLPITKAAPQDSPSPQRLPSIAQPQISCSLSAVVVFLLSQMTIMIRIASGKVLSEPLVALEVIRSQIAVLAGI